jgi:hypothetical protein
LLSVPCFPTRRISGKKSLINYLQSHVMTLEKHLTIMDRKAMDGDAT